jgi:hypothetical protein
VADDLRLSLSWPNVLIGIACVVLANLALAVIEMNVVLPGWHWIWSGLATAVAVLVWFTIVMQLDKRRRFAKSRED